MCIRSCSSRPDAGLRPCQGARRHFGELHIHPNTPGPAGHPEILPIHAERPPSGWPGSAALRRVLRSGAAVGQHPVSSHRAAVGGDTLFASQYAAYDALSPRLKAYLERLTAFHDGGHHIAKATRSRALPKPARSIQCDPSVVRTNPPPTQGAVCQSRLHHADQRTAGRGGARGPELLD